MQQLEREFSYYQANEEALLKQYAGRVIVIVGEEVVSDYQNEVEALAGVRGKYKPGTYMIQRCVPDAIRQIFHSRVKFDGCHT